MAKTVLCGLQAVKLVVAAVDQVKKNASRVMDKSEDNNAPNNKFSVLSSDGAPVKDSCDGKQRRSMVVRARGGAHTSMDQEREAPLAAVHNGGSGGRTSRNQNTCTVIHC